MNAQEIVFAEGTYTCHARHGTATVIVPRNIALGEIADALAGLYEGMADVPKTRNAPRQPTKAREAHPKNAAKAATSLYQAT